MGRDTILRGAVHLIRPNLYLKGLAVASDQSGVQRLVHVLLGHGNVILESPGNGLVHLMNNTQSRIAVLHRINHNAHRKQVVNLIQSLVLLHHLLINAEEVLHPAVHRGLDACVLHVLLYLIHNGLNKCLTGILAQVHLFHQIVIYLGHKEFEGQIIQLNLDLRDTQPIRDRRIDLHGLPRLLLLFLRLPVLAGAHIVETVRQFDDDHPDILRHGEKHLSQILRLNLHLVLVPVQLGQLGNAVHQK